MHPEQETVAREQDNLGIIIEYLTPRVSITAPTSSSRPLVHLASIWRFFDSPYGHPVLFPKSDGGFYRTYWVPVLSKIELYPIQHPSLTISSTAPRPYPELLFDPLVYEDRRPVAERQPFIEMIKSLARTNSIVKEGNIMNLDPKSWFSVIWSQISVDPRYIDLQRDHLLIFYRLNTPQTVSWFRNARSLNHEHHLEMYINYNRFYTEKRSPSNRQLRFSPPESESTTSPLKLLNLSHDAIQRAIDTYDCTYSLLTVHSPILPTSTSDLTWAHNGFQPERSFASPGIINSLKTHRPAREKTNWIDITKYTSFEDANMQPHTTSVCSAGGDHKFLQRDQLTEKRIGVEFLRVKDAFCIHHLCRESAPSADNVLDVFNYFIEHLPIPSNLRIESSTITLKGSIFKNYHESSIISWSRKIGYLHSDSSSTHLGQKSHGCILTDEIKKIFHRNFFTLSEYPRTIFHLYAVLLSMQQHSEVYKDIPLYYRIIINALYYTGLQQIMDRSKTIDSGGVCTDVSSSNRSRKDFNLTISVKNDSNSRKIETNKRDVGTYLAANANSNEAAPSSSSSYEANSESISESKTIAGSNYSMTLLPPYNITSFIPECTSRISSILDNLTLQELHSTLCDLMKHFYPVNTSCIEQSFGKNKSIPKSFKYLHGVGFESMLTPSSSMHKNDDLWHVHTAQLILSHPIFKQSSFEYQQSRQAMLCQSSLSRPTPSTHRSPNIVITTIKPHSLEKQSSDSPHISLPSSAASTNDIKELLTDASSDNIPAVNDVLLQSGASAVKHTPLIHVPFVPSTTSFSSGNDTYISLLLESNRKQSSPNEIKTLKNKTKSRDSKKKEFSITVGASLPPGDKEKYEKIILKQYKLFIKSLYHLFTHRQTDKISDSPPCYSNSYVPYMAFYRRTPSSDCPCDFCHQSLIMHTGSCSSPGCGKCSSSAQSSPSSRVSYDSSLCESITRRLLCSSNIKRYIHSDKTLARLMHFSANYKLTELSGLSSVATKFISSRSIMDGIRLSFLGCLPLKSFHNNLEFYRSTDNSEENLRLIRSKDATHTLKFSEYPVIYHIFLEIILSYVANYHDLAPCMPPKLEKFILKPRVVSKTMTFTDTIDDSAIQLRGGHDLGLHSSRQRPSSAEGRNRERGQKQKTSRLKNQRVGHNNQSSNRGSAVNNSK